MVLPLLPDHENCIKIGDFGLAATDFAPMDTPQAGTPLQPMDSSLDLTSGIGTSLYIAPEVESTSGRGGGSEGRYDDKADLYSLGVRRRAASCPPLLLPSS
jgi:translation initiation factor 2-alpha kinase 4